MYRDTVASELGDLESEFLQLSVDAWSTPTIGCHFANEVSDCGINSRPPGASRDRIPVATESFPMPPCHGVCLHNNQCVRPPRPDSAKRYPEGSISIIKDRPTPLFDKRSHLLTESYVLDNQVSARADNRPKDADGK